MIAFLGGFDQRKGVRETIEALRSWPDAVLLLAGPDLGADRDGIPANVRCLGQLDDVDDVLVAADVLVVPSRFDPFAVVALEAAARGTPVVTTPDVGASDAVLRHGAGLVWDRTDSLSEVIRRALQHRDEHSAGALAMAGAHTAHDYRTRIMEQIVLASAARRGVAA